LFLSVAATGRHLAGSRQQQSSQDVDLLHLFSPTAMMDSVCGSIGIKCYEWEKSKIFRYVVCRCNNTLMWWLITWYQKDENSFLCLLGKTLGSFMSMSYNHRIVWWYILVGSSVLVC